MNEMFWSTAGAGTVIFLALAFIFSNGFRDSSTIVATVVSTRALTPRKAFLLCAVAEFFGALFIGTAILATVGKGLFDPALVSGSLTILPVLAAALVAAIVWGMISWWRVWPVSNNQALMAGLFGAGIGAYGWENLKIDTIGIVFLVLIFSPFLGFLVSMVFTSLIRKVGEFMTPQAKHPLKKLHIVSTLCVSAAHGSNDGQIVMGILVLTLGSQTFFGPVSGDGVSNEIRLIVAAVLALGVLIGGRRLLKRLGMKFFHIQQTQGLGAQLTAASTILTCAFAGFPASTMQVITGSIIGAGVAKNPKAVRWHIAQDIVLSWLITMPAVGILSYTLSFLFRMI